MPVLNYKGLSLFVDDEGFMINPEQWSKEAAEAIFANETSAELTDEHWKVINFLRDYQKHNGNVPMVKKLCTETGHTLKQLYLLFPSGPARGACKVAGLMPVGCV